jgi:hypothetical protein
MERQPQSAQQDILLLDELTQLGMAMARDLGALAMDDAKQAAHQALGFQRAARSVRQTIALKARLLRDLTRHDREDAAHAARLAETRLQVRKAQVRLSVERCVWSEADGSEAERLLDELDDLIEAEASTTASSRVPRRSTSPASAGSSAWRRRPSSPPA